MSEPGHGSAPSTGALRYTRSMPTAAAQTLGKHVAKRKRVPGAVFSIAPPRAGVADALGRIAIAYDVITTHYAIAFEYESYRNYHSKDFDFDRAFGTVDAFRSAASGMESEAPQITLREVVESTLESESPFLPNGRYRVVPDLYHNDPLIAEVIEKIGLERTFYSRLKYEAGENVFAASLPGTRKAVLHLRRQDIVGDELFRNVPQGKIPEAQSARIQARRILTLQDALWVLEQEFGQGEDIDLVIASDGFQALREEFSHGEEVLRNIERLEQELEAELPHSCHQARVVERLLGTDAETTKRTLDAMFHADVVVTASSAFPYLICRFGKTQVLAVQPFDDHQPSLPRESEPPIAKGPIASPSREPSARKPKWKAAYVAEELADWQRLDQPIPPPQVVKVLMLANALRASGYSCFIETGTLNGVTSGLLAWMPGVTVHTIEISEHFYRKSAELLEGFDNVHRHLGDSGRLLPTIIDSIDEPIVFWIDAHYSGGDTGKGELGTPVSLELVSILAHRIEGHFLFIDDARDFSGLGDYPSVTEVIDRVRATHRDYRCEVVHDMIVCGPKELFDAWLPTCLDPTGLALLESH